MCVTQQLANPWDVAQLNDFFFDTVCESAAVAQRNYALIDIRNCATH